MKYSSKILVMLIIMCTLILTLIACESKNQQSSDSLTTEAETSADTATTEEETSTETATTVKETSTETVTTAEETSTEPATTLEETTETTATAEEETTETADTAPAEQTVLLPYIMYDLIEVQQYTYYYDEYGNEIKTVRESMDGRTKTTWVSEYDDNNNLTKRSVITDIGEPFVQLIQIYDDNGNLIEKREFGSGYSFVFTYQYDEQNRPISKSNSNGVVEAYIYEEDGSYRIQSVSSDDNYTSYGADGRKLVRQDGNLKYVYVYRDSENIMEIVVYYGEKVSSKTIYYLDENGNRIRVSEVNSKGNEYTVLEYDYKEYTVKVR